MESTSTWHFQYGPWDLRIHCPVCPQWEAFFCSVLDLEGDIVNNPGKCKNCGYSGPIQLTGKDIPSFVKTSILREQSIMEQTGSKETFCNKKEVYEKAEQIINRGCT